MYAFNHRLDPKTFLAVPIKVAQGGGLCVLILFVLIGLRRPWLVLLFSPLFIFGLRMVIRGFKEYGREHLTRFDTEYRKQDARCTDLNFKGH